MKKKSNLGFRAKSNYRKPDPNIIAGFKNAPVANIGDAMGRFNIMDAEINTINKGDVHLVGTAVTVKVRPGDNLLIHKAVNMAGPGEVLVVDAGGCQCGIWGELLTLWAQKKGLEGLVIDGAVRDKRDIQELGFPVFTRYVTPAGGDKDGPGEINYPISCGNVNVNPGEIIVGDNDGVVVIPAGTEKDVLDSVLKVKEKEKIVREKIERGEWDRPWLEKTLQEKGFTID